MIQQIKFYFSYFICTICLFSNSWAEEGMQFHQLSSYTKMYVEVENLIIDAKQMLLIDHQGVLHHVKSLQTDEQGLFAIVPQFWYCSRCGREHWGACPLDF